ncbi:MAG TPA: macro domain-containing protein [Candidatus Limnocylindria bacterium]
MRIEVRHGDIADQPDLDAVVNAANTELWMGSGVAGALRARGGKQVEEEAVAQGPISLGDAVLTSGGGLPNAHVIHAAAMGYRAEDARVPKTPGTSSSPEIIAACVRRALELAEENKIRSIGFPALATGVGGFPVAEAADAMIGAVRDYERRRPDTKIERVVFILLGDRAAKVYEARAAASASPSENRPR